MKDTVILQLEAAGAVARMNLEGVTHEHSLHQPANEGNCINWVVGHLTATYNSLLPLMGQEAVWSEEVASRYRRGGEPLKNPAEAQEFSDLRLALDLAHERFLSGLRDLPADRLAEPAPFSPGNNPDETLGSLVCLVAFHQAYHVGQLGVLRRVAGLANAVR